MSDDPSRAERELIERAARKARILYEGALTGHRSCGICLAETFNLRTPPYQSLRKGGISGEGHCGAIKAGELILGEIFGDHDPTAPVTETLVAAIADYNDLWKQALFGGEPETFICNDLTSRFAEFRSAERHGFCTGLSEVVARCIAEVLLRHGHDLEITPIAGLADDQQP